MLVVGEREKSWYIYSIYYLYAHVRRLPPHTSPILKLWEVFVCVCVCFLYSKKEKNKSLKFSHLFFISLYSLFLFSRHVCGLLATFCTSKPNSSI